LTASADFFTLRHDMTCGAGAAAWPASAPWTCLGLDPACTSPARLQRSRWHVRLGVYSGPFKLANDKVLETRHVGVRN